MIVERVLIGLGFEELFELIGRFDIVVDIVLFGRLVKLLVLDNLRNELVLVLLVGVIIFLSLLIIV